MRVIKREYDISHYTLATLPIAVPVNFSAQKKPSCSNHAEELIMQF